MYMNTELIYTDISDITLSGADEEALTGILPAYFCEKVRTSKNVRLKMQRLAAGLLFCYAFKNRGLAAIDAEITEGPYGKPVINCPQGLYFNVSHSDNLVLLALADTEVGCDIQKIRSGDNIAARFFTLDENEALKSAEDTERDAAFTRLWARKESYIKAMGEGMKQDLRSFSVLDDITCDGFAFADFYLDGFAAAVCMESADIAVMPSPGNGDICFLPFQSLVNVLL